MFNNTFIIQNLDSPQSVLPQPTRRLRLSTEPCLLERLPSSRFLQREAEYNAPKSILRQLRRSPSPPQDSGSTGDDHPRSASICSSTPSSPSTEASRFLVPGEHSVNNGHWKEPQPFEIFRAVERKDIMFLMEVRDRAFPLLLRKTGDATPLLHAMRIGQSHRDVAIVLLGAFSRWVNHLEDDEIVKAKTKRILKALRTNLKLAIDYGLAKSQVDLTASFLQTLVMSEGDKWVRDQASNVALALRAGTAGKPVQTASAAVRRFATRELGKADLIATLEDYVANATVDLLMMGAWTAALDTIDSDQIPSYYFARDDRVYKAFIERLDKYKATIQRDLSRRLRWQLRVLRTALEGRTTTYRRQVELLSGELDEGLGI